MLGLDDFEIEGPGSIFGTIVFGAMLVVFAVASMITTFSFFVTYAPGLGAVIHPEYGRYIAGALGVLLFDLAGLGWTVLRSQNSDTTKQFVIATIAAVITIALALLVSGLQVLLSSSFDVGLYMADGGLSEFGKAMQITGVIVMTAGFVLNFAAIAAYVNTSKGVTRSVQNTQLRAYVTAGKFAADQARAELVTRQTIEGVFKELPAMAARAGRQNTADYFGHTFTGLDVPDVNDNGELDLEDLVSFLVEERLSQQPAVSLPQPKKYRVWLGTKANMRQTESPAYSDFIHADQAARRMSLGMVEPGTIASVYLGDERLSSYEATAEGQSTAETTPTNYEATPSPLPVRPSSNGREG